MTLHSRTHTVNNDVDQATNMAVIQLQAGDTVWLRFGIDSSAIHGATWAIYDTFAGFLLYEDQA